MFIFRLTRYRDVIKLVMLVTIITVGYSVVAVCVQQIVLLLPSLLLENGLKKILPNWLDWQPLQHSLVPSYYRFIWPSYYAIIIITIVMLIIYGR